jgi:hypothetical protein
MIIKADSVRQHFNHMLAAGLKILSWTERRGDFGHLDFTFSVQQDLKHFVLDGLECWQPPEGAAGGGKSRGRASPSLSSLFRKCCLLRSLIDVGRMWVKSLLEPRSDIVRESK